MPFTSIRSEIDALEIFFVEPKCKSNNFFLVGPIPSISLNTLVVKDFFCYFIHNFLFWLESENSNDR